MYFISEYLSVYSPRIYLNLVENLLGFLRAAATLLSLCVFDVCYKFKREYLKNTRSYIRVFLRFLFYFLLFFISFYTKIFFEYFCSFLLLLFKFVFCLHFVFVVMETFVFNFFGLWGYFFNKNAYFLL